jgi:pimeloyl-ACP methyl ester carboxylesterase
MIESNSFETTDGTDIVWRETGQGRPLLLIHGFMSEADTNWIKYGHSAALADAGYRVIMPDLRAHGLSGKPHAPSHYPADILADDQFALLAHLGIEDYDLGGYSLGCKGLRKPEIAARIFVKFSTIWGTTKKGRLLGWPRHF